MPVPKDFADRIQRTFGYVGSKWLEALPALLDQLSMQWSLSLRPHFEAMSYNYVAPALRSDGTWTVLKVGVPNPELTSEIAALRHFNGQGSAMLLEADTELGALLLERLDPGHPGLDLGDDDRATSIAADVIKRLHKPAPDEGPFPTVADWGNGFIRLRSTFDGSTGPFHRILVERAESILGDFGSSAGDPFLLHGDLHHWNILSSSRSNWLAIDPKGLIGEREYEIGAWLRNPFPTLLKWSDAKQITLRRVDQFVDLLDFDRQRMLAWSVYQAVLAAWWSFEESDPSFEHWLSIANLLSEID